LTKQDFMRATLSVDLTTKTVKEVEGKSSFFSMPAMLGNYIKNEPGLKENLNDCEDNIS